jgi:hypothetical protein
MALLTNRDATRTDPDGGICIIIPPLATTPIALMTHLHINSLSHFDVLRIGWGHASEQWSGRENNRGGGNGESNLHHGCVPFRKLKYSTRWCALIWINADSSYIISLFSMRLN